MPASLPGSSYSLWAARLWCSCRQGAGPGLTLISGCVIRYLTFLCLVYFIYKPGEIADFQ